MIKSCITAIRTLTVFSVPGKDTENFPSSIPFFPVAGGILAGLLYLIYKVLQVFPDIPFLPGIIMVATMILFTGAIHVDGLADVADGFGGGKTKERILEIFKDSRLGTFGVIAVVLDILLKAIMYSWYFENSIFIVIGISIVWSRMSMAAMLTFFSSATPGKGIASSFIGKSYKFQIIISIIFVLILTFAICDYRLVIVLFISLIIVFILFSLLCLKKIGGITGDCLGAINELIELIILITGCILANGQSIEAVF